MKTIEISLKRMSNFTALREHGNLKNIKSENDVNSNIAQIKHENIEFVDNSYDEEDTDKEQFQAIIHANVHCQVGSRSQHKEIVQHEDGRNELSDHLKCDNDVDISAIQDIKHETELDISTEECESEAIESEDDPSNETVACLGCPFESRSIENLQKHIIDNHIEGRQMCKLCNQEFVCSTIEHCSEHLLKGTNRKQSFKQDIVRWHTAGPPLKSEICEKTFLKKSSLTQHLKCHTEERPLKCDICQKAFAIKRNFNEHLKLHTAERPFKCGSCPKSFLYKSSLEVHIRCHTEDRPFKCEICPKAFVQKSCLREHLRRHTREQTFKCDICSKGFTIKRNLKEHLKWHIAERPFKCENCSKTFLYKSNLKIHLRYHSGDRPFKCEICPKSFAQKSYLSLHLKIHKGEQPFKCELCVKTFLYKSKLKLHLSARHTETEN